MISIVCFYRDFRLVGELILVYKKWWQNREVLQCSCDYKDMF